MKKRFKIGLSVMTLLCPLFFFSCSSDSDDGGGTVYVYPDPGIVITSQPRSYEPMVRTSAEAQSWTFTVEAVSRSGGTLSYQWWDQGNSQGTKKVLVQDSSGVRGSKTQTLTITTPYFPDGNTFDLYFYCVVTDTNGNGKKFSTNSSVASLHIGSLDDFAKKPIITKQPVSATYTAGQKDNVSDLTVECEAVSNSIKQTYQWFKNNEKNEGAINKNYRLSCDEVGKFAYYVTVTNSETGKKSQFENSQIAYIEIIASQGYDAKAPSVGAIQGARNYNVGDVPQALTITATSNNTGYASVLSYAWYVNGEIKSTNATYTPTDIVAVSGTYNIYVKVTDTISGSGIGASRASMASATVTITVSEASGTEYSQYPVVSDLEGAEYSVGESAAPLSVTASSPDSGTLKYQWYMNQTAIQNATSSSGVTPSTNVPGQYTYTVRVTNEVSGKTSRYLEKSCVITVVQETEASGNVGFDFTDNSPIVNPPDEDTPGSGGGNTGSAEGNFGDIGWRPGSGGSSSGSGGGTGGTGGGSGGSGSGSGSGSGDGSGSGGSSTSTDTALDTARYWTNKDGKKGTNKTINSWADWTANEQIAQCAAYDDPRTWKGIQEVPYDVYALYAAYDDTNLYLLVELTNIADRASFHQDSYASSDNADWDNRDIPLGLIFNTGKGATTTSTYETTEKKPVWGAVDFTDSVGFNFLTYHSSKWCEKYASLSATSGNQINNGKPGWFTLDPNGHFNYGTAYTKSYNGVGGLGISIKYVPETAVTSQIYYESTPTGNRAVSNQTAETLLSSTSYTAVAKKASGGTGCHDASYWYTIPLTALDIDKNYLTSMGIGVRQITTGGGSLMDCCPWDASMVDCVTESYSQDPSTSKEKEDKDIITTPMARIGR